MFQNNIMPGSLNGIEKEALVSEYVYFSFITLLTIGYGEIVPVSDLAQKAAILVALIGQFYIVILTAIVVGKYINQYAQKN
jgi:voltage-gated potassium channel Kch